MSYILNYFHPTIETNLEKIPIIPLDSFKINNTSNDKIAYLKNVPMTKKNVKTLLTKETTFSKFNIRELAENYEKTNIIKRDDDYSEENIQTIIDILFPQGKKVILNKKNYIVLKATWDKYLDLQKGYSKSNIDGNVYDLTIKIMFKKKEDFTASDRRELNCDERFVQIQADIRDIFQKKEEPEIPIAKPVSGGKKRKRTKRTKRLRRIKTKTRRRSWKKNKTRRKKRLTKRK
jgi:hypothetical protein